MTTTRKRRPKGTGSEMGAYELPQLEAMNPGVGEARMKNDPVFDWVQARRRNWYAHGYDQLGTNPFSMFRLSRIMLNQMPLDAPGAPLWLRNGDGSLSRHF